MPDPFAILRRYAPRAFLSYYWRGGLVRWPGPLFVRGRSTEHMLLPGCRWLCAAPLVLKSKNVRPCASLARRRPTKVIPRGDASGWGWGLTLGNVQVESANSTAEHRQYLECTKVCLYAVDDRVSRAHGVYAWALRALAWALIIECFAQVLEATANDFPFHNTLVQSAVPKGGLLFGPIALKSVQLTSDPRSALVTLYCDDVWMYQLYYTFGWAAEAEAIDPQRLDIHERNEVRLPPNLPCSQSLVDDTYSCTTSADNR